MFGHQLTRELAGLIAVKVLALALLFFLFFGPSARPHVDADTIAKTILSERGP